MIYFLLSRSNCCWRRSTILANGSLNRSFSFTQNQSNLSDPFGSKSDKFKKELNTFNKENRELNKTSALNVQEVKEDVFLKFFKHYFNTNTIGDQLRSKFKLTDDQKLVYLIDNERLMLIAFSVVNIIFPTVIAVLLALLGAEYFEAANLSESFENPVRDMLLIGAMLSIYFILFKVYQGKLVYRIYFDDKAKLYSLFTHTRVLNFRMEQFKAADFKYLHGTNNEQNSRQRLVKALGNVTVNGKKRIIDFRRFNSQETIEMLVGKQKMPSIIRHEK